MSIKQLHDTPQIGNTGTVRPDGFAHILLTGSGVLVLEGLHPFQLVEIVGYIVEWRDWLNSSKFVGTYLLYNLVPT